MGACLSGGTQKGIHCSNVTKHSKRKKFWQIWLHGLFISSANPTRTIVFVPCTVQNNFSTVLFRSYKAPRSFPSWQNWVYILAKNLSTCFKRTERATVWVVAPHTIRCDSKCKKTSNYFFFIVIEEECY